MSRFNKYIKNPGAHRVCQCRYVCDAEAGTCTKVVTAQTDGFSSFQECMFACQPAEEQYACIDGACRPVGSGGVSYEECNSDPTCVIPMGYECVEGSCLEIYGGTMTQAECLALPACATPLTGWECVEGSCVQVNGGGFATEADCLAQCAPLLQAWREVPIDGEPGCYVCTHSELDVNVLSFNTLTTCYLHSNADPLLAPCNLPPPTTTAFFIDNTAASLAGTPVTYILVHCNNHTGGGGQLLFEGVDSDGFLNQPVLSVDHINEPMTNFFIPLASLPVSPVNPLVSILYLDLASLPPAHPASLGFEAGRITLIKGALADWTSLWFIDIAGGVGGVPDPVFTTQPPNVQSNKIEFALLYDVPLRAGYVINANTTEVDGIEFAISLKAKGRPGGAEVGPVGVNEATPFATLISNYQTLAGMTDWASFVIGTKGVRSPGKMQVPAPPNSGTAFDRGETLMGSLWSYLTTPLILPGEYFSYTPVALDGFNFSSTTWTPDALQTVVAWTGNNLADSGSVTFLHTDWCVLNAIQANGIFIDPPSPGPILSGPQLALYRQVMSVFAATMNRGLALFKRGHNLTNTAQADWPDYTKWYMADVTAYKEMNIYAKWIHESAYQLSVGKIGLPPKPHAYGFSFDDVFKGNSSVDVDIELNSVPFSFIYAGVGG